MNLKSKYGYLIQALKQYPFEKEIKARYEEIEIPWRPADENNHIRGSVSGKDIKIINNLIKKETDPILIKYESLKIAIENVNDYYIQNNACNVVKIIEEVYVKNFMTVDGATFKYYSKSRAYGYRNIVVPFFEKLEIEYITVLRNNKREINIEIK